MKRRDFLEKSALTAAGVAALTSDIFFPGTLVAQAPAADGGLAGLKSLNTLEGETLLKMMRQIFPHDRLADKFYAKVAQDLDSQAQASADTAKLLREGLAKLDEGPKKFAALSAEEQLAELQKIEGSEFFKKVMSTELVSLYNNPAVWEQFGYGGSSYEIGGYLNHGFNDLAWLPDPPESASPKAA